MRYYGVALAGLWVGELSLRRLSVLLANLPVGSATWAAENGVPIGTSPTDLILADIYQAIAGQPHPLRPTAERSAEVAKSKHEAIAARLRAQRERLTQSREEAPPSVGSSE